MNNNSFDFRKGYFKALLDIVSFTDTYSSDLQYKYKNQKYSVLIAIIKHILETPLDLDRIIDVGFMYDDLIIKEEVQKKNTNYIITLRRKDD